MIAVRNEWLLVMQWTAPTTGITMCRIGVSVDERRMSPFGYEPKFWATHRDGELGAESGPSSHNVGFLAVYFGFSPDSGRASKPPLMGIFDPGCVKTPDML